MGIGYRIQKCRESKGIKQEELAEKVELSSNYLSAIEREVKSPKLNTLIRIINALEVSADVIMIDEIESETNMQYTQLEEKIKKLSTKERKKVLHILDVILVASIIVIECKKEEPDISLLWQNIVLSILCSVASSIFFGLIQKVFSDDESKELDEQLSFIESSLRLQNDLFDSGILSIHPKSHFDKEDDFWNNVISNTENKLNLIGHSLSNWFKICKNF